MFVINFARMKNYLHLIYGLLITGLLIAIVISYHNNDVLESRISTINKHLYKDLTVDTLASEKTFKEDYYIEQQSRDTTLILTVFGVLAGLVSLFTFLSIERRLTTFKEEVKEKQKNYQIEVSKKQKWHNKKLKKVKKNLWETYLKMSYELIYIKRNSASKALTAGNQEDYVIDSFECAVQYSIAYLFDNNVDKVKIITELISFLNSLNEYLKHSPITIDLEFQSAIIKDIDYINKIGDSEIYDLLNSIYGRLIFK